jgi:hypothetical protein
MGTPCLPRARVLQETWQVAPLILSVEEAHAIPDCEFFAPNRGVFKRREAFWSHTSPTQVQLVQGASRRYQPAVRAADQHVALVYVELSAGENAFDRFGQVGRWWQRFHVRLTAGW